MIDPAALSHSIAGNADYNQPRINNLSRAPFYVRVQRKAERVSRYSVETSATPQSHSYITSRFWLER